MDAFRYWLAVAVAVGYPVALSFWLIVHPFIETWRRLGLAVTYIVAATVMSAIGYGLYGLRDTILAVDYGTHWPLLVSGAALLAASIAVETRCRRRLARRTLVGIPELRRETTDRLLTDGIYARVRHPRYLGGLLGGAASALLANHLALYLMLPVLVLLVYVVTVLEERELVDRFGDAYREYQARVPRLWSRGGLVDRARRGPES